MGGMRVVFAVQGEGRGHMTQAIALKTILEQAGHEVVQVVVGKSEERVIPQYFTDKMMVPVNTVSSPGFAASSNNKGVRMLRSIPYNVKMSGKHLPAMKEIDRLVKQARADIIINFYELMTGLYNVIYKPEVPMINIAHQYMFFHPEYKFPKGYKRDKVLARLYTTMTCARSAGKLAISLWPAEDMPEKGIKVVPPLLRNTLFDQVVGEDENFLLIYLLNKGYGEDIIRWHKQHPDVCLHCFWDNREVGDEYVYDNNLTFHQLHDTKFLDKMARCRGLVTTAGFESVCEAMYLGKPVYMMPTEGHFEQMLNALDAASVGAGIYGLDFGITRFMNFIPEYSIDNTAFREWIRSSPEIYLNAIESVLSRV